MCPILVRRVCAYFLAMRIRSGLAKFDACSNEMPSLHYFTIKLCEENKRGTCIIPCMSKILNQTYVGRTSCGLMDFLVRDTPNLVFRNPFLLPTAVRTIIILSLESIGKKSNSGYAHAQHLFSPISHLLNMRACVRLCELSGCM